MTMLYMNTFPHITPATCCPGSGHFRVGFRPTSYIYINTDDGWNDFNRSAGGGLHPHAKFTNGTMNALTDSL
jgi:hypothetical protein